MNRKLVRTIRLAAVVSIGLAIGPAARGQAANATQPKVGTTSKVATHQEHLSPDRHTTLAAIDRAARGGKYAFLFFFRADDQRTKAMRTGLEASVSRTPDKAEIIAVDVSDPLQRGVVSKYHLSRAPTPLILAVAPNGAITKVWLRSFRSEQYEQAFVSDGQARCLKALQERKTLLVCIQDEKTTHNDEAMAGVKAFVSDPRWAKRSTFVLIAPSDEAETGFLKKLGVSPATKEAVTVLLAPPGRPLATFTGPTRKAAFVAALRKASSGCTPGSGCCGPRKPSAKARGRKKP